MKLTAVQRYDHYASAVIILLIISLLGVVPSSIDAFMVILDRTTTTTTKQGRRRIPPTTGYSTSFTVAVKSKQDEEVASLDNSDSTIIGSTNTSSSSAANYIARIRSNVLDGTIGERGEGYVAIQAVLFVGLVLGYLPVVQETIDVVFGPIIFLAGVSIILGSVLALGPVRLSPWPVPPSTATATATKNTDEAAADNDGLVTTGWLYGQVRHPLYTGVLLSGIGLSILTNSATRFLFTVFLWYLFDIKSDYEEKALQQVFGPIAYGSYRDKVPNKFLPKSLLDILYDDDDDDLSSTESPK